MPVKNNIIRIIYFFVILFLAEPVFSMTSEEAIEKLAERLNVETLKGNLSVTYQSGEIYSGIFMYMRPGKMYVKFSSPAGKLIVTNGKKLWVYDASTDVCGVQDLETEEDAKGRNESGDIKPRLSGGILGFLHGYAAIVTESPSQQVIELTNESRKYSEVKLILSPDFMLSSIIFKDKEGDGFAVKLSDVKTGEKITPGIFNFKAPSNAQVVKNPLDIR